ncbi:MAG: zinc metallopeptidase [Planctomycetota bacterium]|nr:zinc metallopeptidase [Planctomycetota bacterium]
MRWEGREQSTNVEDRRGMAMAAGGLIAGGGVGTIVLMIIMMFLGGNPKQLLEQVGEQQEQSSRAKLTPQNDPDASLMEFVSVVMKDNEDVWGKLFREELGTRYREPKLVVFQGQVNSACGQATAQVGPFYCPGDSNVYLDFDFFRELRTRFHAPGDFAMAYVVAHEVGHHVQNQLGLSSKIQAMQNRAGKVESNELSVRLELQADYLAGVWAHHAQASKKILEAGDVGSAMTAANQIGDDKLTQGRVRKENFTHGTSQQRVKWYSAGLASGDVKGMMKLFELDFDKL